jgi:hypothetical protein
MNKLMFVENQHSRQIDADLHTGTHQPEDS